MNVEHLKGTFSVYLSNSLAKSFPTVFPNVVFDCSLHFFAIGVSTPPFMYVHIVQGLDKKLGQIQKGTIALPACHFAKAI